MLHVIRRLITRFIGSLGAGRCIGCNVRLNEQELASRHCECHACLADWGMQ